MLKSYMPKIHAARSENNFPLPSKVRKAISKFDIDSLRFYQEKNPLIERLADEYDMPTKQVVLGQGSIGLINLVLAGMNRNFSILLPEFGYLSYFSISRKQGIRIETFKVEDRGNSFEYRIDDIRAKLAAKPDVLVLIDPETYVGCSLKSQNLDYILKNSPPRTLVILDQAHEGVRTGHPEEARWLMRKYRNLVILRSFSKLYGLAALRIGYALCGDDAVLRLMLPDTHLGFSSIAQTIAVTALDQKKEYDKIAAEMREQKARFDGAVAKLPGHVVYKTDGMSCLVKVPDEQIIRINELSKKTAIEIRNYETCHKGLKGFFGVTIGPFKQTTRLIGLFEQAMA